MLETGEGLADCVVINSRRERNRVVPLSGFSSLAIQIAGLFVFSRDLHFQLLGLVRYPRGILKYGMGLFFFFSFFVLLQVKALIELLKAWPDKIPHMQLFLPAPAK